MSCEVEVFDLDSASCPAILALSYLWGNSEETLPAVVNGERVGIGQNLPTALQDINDSGTSVGSGPMHCINQANLAERASQVQLMQRSYSEAQKVICHLGGGPTGKECPDKPLEVGAESCPRRSTPRLEL